MLKLRRLRVERFRSLAGGAELSFSDGVNVVLGQNGTGKTTLLELISMIVRSDFSSLAKEEFAVEYELSVPEGERIIVLVRNDRVAMEQVQTPVELGQREVFRASAKVLGADRRQLLEYDAERGFSIEDAPAKDPALGFLGPVDRGFLAYYLLSFVQVTRIQTFTGFADQLLQAGNAYRLDESLELFGRITGAGEFAGKIHISRGFQDVMTPPFVPDSIVQGLATSHTRGKADHSFTQSDLALLITLKDMMGFSATELRVDVTEERDPGYLRIGNLVFRFWWEDDTFITHDRLSYGQKRLLTFFYYLACSPQIMIADELVNGLHHRWITASIDAIGQRQAFLTSQNPLLLDYIAITSAAEVRRSFVLCRAEAREGRPGWIWENMTEEDAAELFSAYQIGIEHVSEILQSRGLW